MNKTINDIPAATRIGLKNIIVGLGKETMIELMDSFKDTKYGSLGYRTIMATYGDCNDARATGHFLDMAAGRLMPVSVMVDHVRLVAPADRSVVNWFISKGYYVEAPAQVNVYPMPPMTIPPPNPLQQAVVNLNAKLDEAILKLKLAEEKIDALSKSLRVVENENVELRERNLALEKQKVTATVIGGNSGNGGTGDKRYLYELSQIDMKWILNLIYAQREAVNIGIYIQSIHKNICITEGQIRASYGAFIPQIDVVKYLLYELSKYQEVSILDLANTLKQVGLVYYGNQVIKEFNL